MFTRTGLMPGENFYTQIPNHWIRDPRLPGLAFRVLCFWVSHEVGYRVTMEQTVAELKEGRDAIYTAVGTLRKLNYVKRSQARGKDGKVGQVEYELGSAAFKQQYVRNWGKAVEGNDAEETPAQTASGNPGSGAEDAGQAASWKSGSGEPGSGAAVTGRSDAKKNNPLEQQPLEDQGVDVRDEDLSLSQRTATTQKRERSTTRKATTPKTPSPLEELIAEARVLHPGWAPRLCRKAIQDELNDGRPLAVVAAAWRSCIATPSDGPPSPGRFKHAGPWWDAALRQTGAVVPPAQRGRTAADCLRCTPDGLVRDPAYPDDRYRPLDPPQRCGHAVMAGAA